MQQVFERFENFEFYVNLKKCEFDIEEVKFLDFIVFTKKSTNEFETNLND